jgi:predicted molibdopterin-dependent oxidoreductase YjgC
MVVESETEEINAERRSLTQMLFVEGNHFCPSCEMSGNCQLQATAYHLGMMSPHYDHFFPNRAVDASHPEVRARFQPLHPLFAVRARQSRRRWKECLRAVRARDRDAPYRQCQIRATWRYRLHAR